MSMDPELWLQQCRIYQNKDKEAITLPYADADNFYKSLDGYVFEGYKLTIFFLNAKLTQNSLLLERIISCFNGRMLIDDYQKIYTDLRRILAFASQEDFIAALTKGGATSHKIYSTYLFEYQETPDGEPVLSLEPAGEGLPSTSFTIDI
jgi:hypothetical protein